MFDIIIIGSGPAGMTAAIYAKRARKNILVLEATSYGGQIINSKEIENYPGENHISGFDFATNLYNQMMELGVEFQFEKVIGIKQEDSSFAVITEENQYKTKTIILATGAKSRKLGLEKEEEWIGKGISYCATCDGNFFKEKNVAVVGGGNTAIEDALYLSDIAKEVKIIYRGDQLKGDTQNIELLKEKDNIKILYNSTVEKLLGNTFLEGIQIKTDNQIKDLPINGLFIAIGQNPNTEFLKEIILLDQKGYIIAGENCHTNIDGIFVAGDNRTKELRQLVTATSDGAIAATEAIKYLNN